MSTKFYAVITGDIIDSSLLTKSERKKLPDALNAYYNILKKYFKDSSLSQVELYSGDRFQLLVNNPADSLRIAVALKMILKSGSQFKSINSRLSVAVGTVDFINKNKLSQSDGDAFRTSGRNLDIMNDSISISLPEHLSADYMKVIINLLDFILSKTTPKQSLALFYALSGLNQSQISKLWKPRISQQSISLHLINSGWNSILSTVEYFENKLYHL
jgi:hypothetical protein